jgi:hypothetical protein
MRVEISCVLQLGCRSLRAFVVRVAGVCGGWLGRFDPNTGETPLAMEELMLRCPSAIAPVKERI